MHVFFSELYCYVHQCSDSIVLLHCLYKYFTLSDKCIPFFDILGFILFFFFSLYYFLVVSHSVRLGTMVFSQYFGKKKSEIQI